MPFAIVNNTNNFDIVVKKLRRREVPCLVPSICPHSKRSADSILCSSLRNICKKTPIRKRRSCVNGSTRSPKFKKCSKSVSNLERSKIVSPNSDNHFKRLYKKKSLPVSTEYSKRASKLNSSTDSEVVQLNSIYAIPRKSYRKRKSLPVSTEYSKRASNLNSSTVGQLQSFYAIPRKSYRKKKVPKMPNNTSFIHELRSCYDDSNSTLNQFSVSTMSSSKTGLLVKSDYSKKTSGSKSSFGPDISQSYSIYAVPQISYRRKKVQKVPHNTPVIQELHGSIVNDDSNPNSTTSQVSVSTVTYSQTSISTDEFRFPSSSINESSSTSPINNWELLGSTPKRARRKTFHMEYSRWQEDEENEPLSEYELQRQKNIEENLEMLRRIIGEDNYNQDTSQAVPKIRKSYGKVPLPPPRPKSERIEKRRSNYPLNFSKLNEMLLLD